MAHNDHDWQIFKDHEVGIRDDRADRDRPPTRIITSLRNEFEALIDPHAYAQGIVDIEDAQHLASGDYQQAEIIAQMKTENPDDPWHQPEINALWRANRSQLDVWNALLRFTTKQKRIRPNGVSNADATSRNWTKCLQQETRSKMQYIKGLWAQAREPVHAARAEARSRSSSAANAEDEGCAAEDANEMGEASEGGQRPLDAPQVASSSGSPPIAVGRRKRGRVQDFDDDPANNEGQRTNNNSRTANESSVPVIRPESESSERRPLADVTPLEQELNLMQDLDAKWQAFLGERDGQVRSDWERLYHRAQKLVEANQPALFPPEDASNDAMEAFRVTVNKALLDVLGWDWEEYADIIKANEAGLYQEGELQHAEVAREAIMQKAREGQSPIWPPAPRQAPHGPPIDFEAQERAEIANAMASELVHEGDREQSGQWNYLTSVGKGGYGEAQLWTSVRRDDHGMIAEVSAHCLLNCGRGRRAYL